jgi:hypothetical protein
MRSFESTVWYNAQTLHLLGVFNNRLHPAGTVYRIRRERKDKGAEHAGAGLYYSVMES